ncbi:neuraminidase-like domain-containing protein [Pseudomonas mosselii]|uniref:Tc toxin subunit A-related protein n=1 Tax=Pseudomonas mosselii TaxID=78327 RepID=UPI0021A6EFCA|nr:neuraminidase-like domain-containing protein [Pseudomonas mosselii]MEA3233046.1 neuraminidase-like domain-containing protein [Pseudomonas mosselii]UWS65631.1 neuraminidase-like domain-containing protein [Pseudomonas mosselii]
MNDLSNPASSNMPASRKDAATYNNLFPDDTVRCAPGALQANTSQAAYLVYLKEMVEALETRADVTAPITLQQRRPDLLQLKLDERSARKALPCLRLLTGLLEQSAQEALPNDQTLQQAVAAVVHQGNVPFHASWESVKTALALKQLPLLDALRAAELEWPAFIFDHLTLPAQRAATTLSSGFSPELRARLLAPGATDPTLKGLTTTQAVSKALALTRKELRQLLAVTAIGEHKSSVRLSQHVSTADHDVPSSAVHGAEYVNQGDTALYLTQQDPADKRVSINGITDGHLDRLQRILLIQRALQLNPGEADWLVMAAIWSDESTEDFALTDNTLRALGLFRHLQQKYGISPLQYAALICEICVYGTDRETPFYDQLFAPATLEDGGSAPAVMKLDGQEFDPQSTHPDDVLTVKQLCLAFKVSEPVLCVVLEKVVNAQGLTKPTRSLEVVSACYRLTLLPRLLGLPAEAGMLALALLEQEQPACMAQLAGWPTLAADPAEADIVDVIVAVMDTMEWLKQQPWNVNQLFLILQSEQPLFRPRWKMICTAAISNEPELQAVLQQVLELDNVAQVLPLLRWVGLDTHEFRERMVAIAQRFTDPHVPMADCFTPADLDDWALLDRHAAFVKMLGLGAGTLTKLLEKPEYFDLLDETGTVLRELDLSVVYLLSRYKALLARRPTTPNENNLLDYLASSEQAVASPVSAADQARAWASLETVLGEAQGSLARLTALSPPTTLGEIDRLVRLLDLSSQHGISIDGLVGLGQLPDTRDHAPFQHSATALRQGCNAKQRKALDARQSVAWRDGLVNWMLAIWVPADSQRSWITKPQALADYLLIDVQVSHEPKTTRLMSAIASLQRYLHQIHSRQENGYRDTQLSEAERDEWQLFASRYENWKLRQQVRNEPHNFIDPTRRARKTSAFAELENLLAQGKCQPQDIQHAMVSYLSSFEKLSNIQPISAYADGTSPLTDTYHFIGKTNVEPVEYYWRTLDMSQRDQNNAPSMLAWGEWEKISLTISGELATTSLSSGKGSGNEDTRERIELIRPVIIAGRRYAVWAEWGATALAMGKDNKPSPYYPLKVCFAFQQTDGAWSPANELLNLDGTGPGTAFDFSHDTPKQEKGSADNHPSLKTKAFVPGLCVMVNSMGIRQHDPWLTVMLFDAHPNHFQQQTAKTKWEPDQDYFLVAKDLLLLEPRHLDAQRSGPRPIEEALVKDWLSFFCDPRTVQHPYVGAVSTLEQSDDGKEAFSWSSRAEELFKTRFEVTNKGQADLEEVLNNDRTEHAISLKIDSSWKNKANQYTFTRNKFEFELDNEKITIELSNPLIIYITPNEVSAILATKRSVKATKIFSAHSAPRPGMQDEKYIAFNWTHNAKKTIHLRHKHEISTETLAIIKCDPSYGLETHPIIITPTTKSTSPDNKNEPDDGISPISLILQKTENPKHPTIKTTLTTSIPATIKPNWVLSQDDQLLLNKLNLNALKDFATHAKTGDAIQQFSRALLKVRYTTQNDYNRKMGLPEEAGADTRLSVPDAIERAKTHNNAAVMNAYINEEVAAVLADIGSEPEGISLEAAVRLRHHHPQACRRILLYLDPSHQLVFEDECIADGNGKVGYRVPISQEITQFTYKIELHHEEDLLGSLSQGFTLKNQADDAVPSVHILRNSEQALYLELSEANQKAHGDQALPIQSLRLNTLFGKQLVALATQSVEAALSWPAQCLPEPRLEAGSTATTVDFRGANGLYFWELFFHAPFLVAWQLRQNREYREAWRWCTRHLFDPYRTWTSSAGNHPPLYWLSQPIIAPAAYDVDGTVNDPDLLAYAAPERYRKALHLFVAESWQRQGDDLYRQLARDTLVEAAICYDKALRLIGVLPEQFSTAPTQPPSLADARITDFVPPLDSKLVELRNLLRNRLFNLRHGLTLDGKPATVLLEPEVFNQLNLGYAGASQDAAQSIRVARPVPPCRYAEVRKSADAAVLQLIELGQTMLRLYDRESALQLSLLGKANLIKLLDFPCRLQEQALESAKRGRETLLASRRMVEQRLDYYENLVVEGLTPLEEAAIGVGYWSRAYYAMSIPFELAAGITDTIPTIFGLAFGGSKPASPAVALATGSQILGKILEITSEELERQAGYQLRSQEWQFQANQARLELQVLDRQLLEQDIHIRAARIAVDEARATQAAHRAEYEVMTTVFASHPTYLWLIGRLSGIYSSAYDATLSLCLMAEACLQYELGDFRSTWIKTDGWLENWRGMLAGEALERDLMQMDMAAINNNERPLDIRLDLSLRACMGWTVKQLHEQLETDKILFKLTSRHFDEQYPGHYLRRIERITLTLKDGEKTLSGALAAILVQTSNTVLLSGESAGVQCLYSDEQCTEDCVLHDLRPSQQIAIWSAKEINRNFDLQPSPKDETRYQPFEGTGAISSWVLSFPAGAKANALLYKGDKWLFTDIAIQISYTAVDGGEALRDEVKALLQKEKAKESTDAQAKEEKPQADVAAAAEAKRKAEVEAKREAEAEAKRKAEAEAKHKAEAEAKRKAEAEAKRKAEAEAKRKAEAEAKRKAEAEAKRKADEFKKASAAKLKADSEKKAAEAKRKAEQAKKDAEAKRKTDALAAVETAKLAEKEAKEALKIAESDAKASALKAPMCTSVANKVKDTVAQVRQAVDEATVARKAAETAAKSNDAAKATAASRDASKASEKASIAANIVKNLRMAVEPIKSEEEIFSMGEKLMTKNVTVYQKDGTSINGYVGGYHRGKRTLSISTTKDGAKTLFCKDLIHIERS